MAASRGGGGLVEVGLPALTVMFGMQSIRALLPLLVYLLRDRMGWTATQLGVYALILFALSFLAAPLWRLLGVRTALLATAGGLGVLRLVMQLWRGDPVVLVGLASAATLLFLLFLPTYLLGVRPGGPAATARYGVAIVFGLAMDTALHGLLLTWDLVWRNALWASVLAVALVGAQIFLLVRLSREPVSDVDPARAETGSGGRGAIGRWGRRDLARVGGPSLPFMGIGPALALALLLFENVARTAALAGWGLPLAYDVVMVTQVAAATVACLAAGHTDHRAWKPVSGIGLLLVAVCAVAPDGTLLAVAGLLVGQMALATLLVFLSAGLAAPRAPDRVVRLSAANGAGMLLFVLVLFLTYSGYDIALPVAAEALPPIAAAVVAVCAVLSARALPRREGASAAADVPVDWGPALAAAALLLLPAALFVQTASRQSLGIKEPVESLRVMTYNLHNGFDTLGRLDLEALARTIEGQRPDVVALQEVDRGWVIDGSTDLVEWLARRLDMPVYVYGPTAGPLWGNAVLSHRPILSSEVHSLPTEDLPLRRGYIRAWIDRGPDAEPLDVIATHYHHLEDGSAVRVQESQTILDAWGDAPAAVFLGDLNAEPGAPEIEMLRRAGLVEAVAAAGIDPGYTYSSDDPYQRIDYVWVSPDLADGRSGRGLREVVITSGTASDHLGVAATLGR